jgi:hypothetical protein
MYPVFADFLYKREIRREGDKIANGVPAENISYDLDGDQKP